MRALIQRVSEAGVAIDGNIYSRIGPGLVILLGVRKGENADAAEELAERCANLRIFPDEDGKMNLSVRETGGEALVISQFTLYAETRKGNRPGFSDAAPSSEAEPLYERFVQKIGSVLGKSRVGTGIFGAMMHVSLVNDGPVTVMLESRSRENKREE